MKLNVRAVLQLLRERHIPVSPTSASDMEIGSETDMATKDDPKIFCKNGEIKGWNYLTCDVSDLSDVELEDDSKVAEDAHPAGAVVGGELMEGMQGTEERAGAAELVFDQSVRVTA